MHKYMVQGPVSATKGLRKLSSRLLQQLLLQLRGSVLCPYRPEATLARMSMVTKVVAALQGKGLPGAGGAERALL